jgi:hypothetical protein
MAIEYARRFDAHEIMLRNFSLVLEGLIGAVIGVSGVWIFHYILDVNASYITSHKALTAIVGTLGMLFFANIVYSTKLSEPREYGLLVLGIACGIFLQAIIYLRNPCSDDCSTDFLPKLGACVILMVDGFTSFYRKPSTSTIDKPATGG